MAFHAPYIVIYLLTFLCFFCRRDDYVGFVKTRPDPTPCDCLSSHWTSFVHRNSCECAMYIVVVVLVVVVVVEMHLPILACQTQKLRMHTGRCVPTFVRAKCREQVDKDIDTFASGCNVGLFIWLALPAFI